MAFLDNTAAGTDSASGGAAFPDFSDANFSTPGIWPATPGGSLTTPAKVALGVGVVALAVLLIWPGNKA